MGMTPLRTGMEAGGMGHGRIMGMRGGEGQGEFVPGVEGKFRGVSGRKQPFTNGWDFAGATKQTGP